MNTKTKNQTTHSYMKIMIKLTSLAAIIAAFAGAAAYADDPQLQERLALQRAQDARTGQGPTIAFYSHGRGMGQTKDEARPKLHFEMRYNAEGQAFGVYTTGK